MKSIFGPPPRDCNLKRSWNLRDWNLNGTGILGTGILSRLEPCIPTAPVPYTHLSPPPVICHPSSTRLALKGDVQGRWWRCADGPAPPRGPSIHQKVVKRSVWNVTTEFEQPRAGNGLQEDRFALQNISNIRMFENVRECSRMFENVRECSRMFEIFWTFHDQFWNVLERSGHSGCSGTSRRPL